MLFIHVQLSLSAKMAVVICSIVATLLWCSGMIMCAIVYRNLILNAEISLFCHRLGVAPTDPHIWDCLLGKTRTPFYNLCVRA